MRFRYIRPLAAGAAAAIIAAPDAMMADIYHRPPLKTWSTDHAVTPHLGQGANQTIEDAITLAVLLRTHKPQTSQCADEGANGISAFMVHTDDEGFSVGPKERKMGIKGSPTTELYFENCHIPGDRIIGEPGTGLKTALKTLDHTRPTVGAQAVGVAQGALEAAVGYTKDRKQFGKSISSFQAVRTGRHGDEGGGGEVDGVHRRGPRPARRARPQFHLGGRQVLRLRRRHECHRVSGPAAGRRRIHPRLPARADDARRQDHPNLRRHQPDSAHRDVPRPARGLTPPRGDKEFAMHRTGEISAPDVGGADVV